MQRQGLQQGHGGAILFSRIKITDTYLEFLTHVTRFNNQVTLENCKFEQSIIPGFRHFLTTENGKKVTIDEATRSLLDSYKQPSKSDWKTEPRVVGKVPLKYFNRKELEQARDELGIEPPEEPAVPKLNLEILSAPSSPQMKGMTPLGAHSKFSESRGLKGFDSSSPLARLISEAKSSTTPNGKKSQGSTPQAARNTPQGPLSPLSLAGGST